MIKKENIFFSKNFHSYRPSLFNAHAQCFIDLILYVPVKNDQSCRVGFSCVETSTKQRTMCSVTLSLLHMRSERIKLEVYNLAWASIYYII